MWSVIKVKLVIFVILYNHCDLLASAKKPKVLPEYFPNCHRFDPKLNECLLNATEQVKPYLVKGLPEYGIPTIDPLVIPEVTLEQGTRALNFKATLKNITVYGLKNYKFSKFDFDVPNLQWFVKGDISPLDLEGLYTVKGNVLLAPIEGSGTFTAGIATCEVDAYQKVKKINKKGEEYVTPVNTTTRIKVSGPKVKISGLFEGNEDLNRATNQAITENIDVLFEDLKPVIETVITDFLEKILLGTLEDNIPFDKLYPPIP